jgi:phosphoribosylformylglycinamidine cyclo-ligase
MGANDNAAHNGMPVILTDEVSCGSDDFYQTDEARALAASFERACFLHETAMVQGESPPYKYLMNATPPVLYAPSLSVNVIGITKNYISGEKVRPGDVMVVFKSSGWHANGASVIIKCCLERPDSLSVDCGCRTFGEEALIPTRSYVNLVEALTDGGIDVHAFLPMTGSGAGKPASDGRYFYKIDKWWDYGEFPPLMQFMVEFFGMTRNNLLQTFNCGGGYMAIMPRQDAERALHIASQTLILGEEGFHSGIVAGEVQEGNPGTYFGPWDIYLPPPGE